MIKEFNLSFENCRNIAKIDGGYLSLQYNRLNVLFGSNGTGKTTISKVLDCWCNPDDSDKRSALDSFAYMQSRTPADAPIVHNAHVRANPILIFNSEWVDNHCFHENGNLQSRAYELYVSSSEVRRLERDRGRYLTKLDAVLHEEKTRMMCSMADSASKAIGTTMRGKVGTTFKDNAPLEGLPGDLAQVVKKMRDRDKALWMGWHIQGASHAKNLDHVCPYCGTKSLSIHSLIAYDDMHATKQGDAWASAVSVFAEGKVFRISVNRQALKLLSGTIQPDKDDQAWLLNLACRAKALSDCVSKALSTLGSFGDNSSNVFFDELRSCLQTLEDEAGFTDEIRSVMREITSAIKRVLSNEIKIRKLVSELEAKAADNASMYKAEIDYMLEKCGYPYTIEIVSNCSAQESRVVLRPITTNSLIETQPRKMLSYGEQNTLALILFMFEAIASRDSCLIVLDDPISSFDGDKRFALLYRMFHNYKSESAKPQRESLAGRTVILLTHDYLVVSDVLTILGNKMLRPRVIYLACDKNGMLIHREVGLDAVRPYVQMIRRRIHESATRDIFFQLVYLRCYCEMLRKSKDDKKTREGCAFVIISLLVDSYDWKEALKVLQWDGGPSRPYILRAGESLINEYVPGFDFKTVFDDLRNDEKIYQLFVSEGITPYEKLQVLRLLIRQSKIVELEPVMVRYANEVYHLAGDYLLQLDPVDFNPVPPFVADWCERVFSSFIASIWHGEQSTITS